MSVCLLLVSIGCLVIVDSATMTWSTHQDARSGVQAVTEIFLEVRCCCGLIIGYIPLTGKSERELWQVWGGGEGYLARRFCSKWYVLLLFCRNAVVGVEEVVN